MESFSEQERWLTIPGYKAYMVSDLGRVKSLARSVRCGPSASGFRLIPGLILSPFICKQTGYWQVAIHKKKMNVHRLVALAFLGDPPTQEHQVNHINGIRTDSRLANLEWVTASENIRHAYRSNGRVNPFKGRMSDQHPTSRAVVATNLRSGAVLRFACGLDAVRTGLFRSDGISRACSGKIAHHAGYRWEYAEIHSLPA